MPFSEEVSLLATSLGVLVIFRDRDEVQAAIDDCRVLLTRRTSLRL